MATQLQKFLRWHPVFTYQMLAEALREDGTKNRNTINAMLRHHISKGHIMRIKYGLFAAIPLGSNPDTYPINPYLIASFATKDAIIAYYTALAFYGVTYSTTYKFTYLSYYKAKFQFRNEYYQSVTFPKSLIAKNQEMNLVNKEDVQGMTVKVTSLERTLVDVLDKPLLAHGWEEIWRSLDMIDHLDIKKVINYTILLEHARTIALVGFYLEGRREELSVNQKHLDKLQQYRSSSVFYMDNAAKKDGKFIKDWNLIVPTYLTKKYFEESLRWEPQL